MTEEKKFVRVFDNEVSQKKSRWVMKVEDMESLTPIQIQAKFNLPNVPTHFSTVNVPAGTFMEASFVGKNKFGSIEGAIQYKFLDSAYASTIEYSAEKLIGE